ncbi:hypothetical protein KGF57_000705 [Candida theae]|uniref:Uncharacterized protein n=1 Tax=Candida theae TaxID=1198502 RepID=A0AAD5BI95_9ASCO|nr:uncharacterized protein KGF57_000705 [Candida theae]KAI5965439.1 hypothetical protein KGF57_000705 [Candida theae]
MAPLASAQYPLVSSPSNGGLTGEVFGSINFMNESVFNFRIFERKNKSSLEDHDHNANEQLTEVDYDPEKQALSTSSSSASSTLPTGGFSATSVNKEEDVAKLPNVAATSSGPVPKVDEGSSEESENAKVTKSAESNQKDDTEGDGAVVDEAVVEEEEEEEEEQKDTPERGIEDKNNHPNSDDSSEYWLRYEKEKFMKICETCWDEFVKSRVQQ